MTNYNLLLETVYINIYQLHFLQFFFLFCQRKTCNWINYEAIKVKLVPLIQHKRTHLHSKRYCVKFLATKRYYDRTISCANNLDFKLGFKLFNFTCGIIVNDWTLILCGMDCLTKLLSILIVPKIYLYHLPYRKCILLI